MNFKQFLDIIELRTKVVSLSGLALGSLAALLLAGPSGNLDWPALALMWLASLAVDMGTTAFNSFFGYWDGSDDRRHNRESDKVLVHQGVAPGYALLVALALFALAGGLGLALCVMSGWWLLPCGLACMAVGFLYNGGPLPLARTPLGEVFAGGFLGWVLPVLTALIALGGTNHPQAITGSSTSLFPALDPRLALIALPQFLFVAAILSVNNTCDLQGDRQAGRRTLSILLGPAAARFLPPVLITLAWLAALANCLGDLLAPWTAAILAAGALASLPACLAMDRRGFSHATKGPNMGQVSRLFLLFSLTELAALTASLICSGP